MSIQYALFTHFYRQIHLYKNSGPYTARMAAILFFEVAEWDVFNKMRLLANRGNFQMCK